MGIEINLDVLGVVKNFLIIGILLIAILFILTHFGIVGCGTIPFWCDIYEGVMGSPRVLIVQGEDGLGDPEALKLYLQDPEIVGAETVDVQHVGQLSLGNLQRYKLVIVSRARKISARQLDMFRQYVLQGGRLVWTGDAGVEKGEDELQDLSDVNALAGLADDPWVRAIDEGDSYVPVNFDEVLGLRYVDNYCNEVDCQSNLFSVGKLVPESTRSHSLVYGSASQMNFKINKERNFALVKPIPNSPNLSTVMTVDFGGKVSGKEEEIGNTAPFIVTKGLGQRVSYYAYPPEWLVQDNNSYNLIKNMYYGMLGK